MTPAPSTRVRALNDAPIRSDGTHVLYWMVAFRRPRWNFALQHAAAHAAKLGKPLVILEALRVGYPWASDRFHQFILDGMRANLEHFATKNVSYIPYVEPTHGAGRGLVEALSTDACVVVSDDYPCFFIPSSNSWPRVGSKAYSPPVPSTAPLSGASFFDPADRRRPPPRLQKPMVTNSICLGPSDRAGPLAASLRVLSPGSEDSIRIAQTVQKQSLT